jgi:hypothetical protein
MAANGVQTPGWEARGEAEDTRPFAYQLPDEGIDLLFKKMMGCEWPLRGLGVVFPLVSLCLMLSGGFERLPLATCVASETAEDGKYSICCHGTPTIPEQGWNGPITCETYDAMDGVMAALRDKPLKLESTLFPIPGYILFSEFTEFGGYDDGEGAVESSDGNDGEPLYCHRGLGLNYRGDIATTESGSECQRWDAQLPNAHSTTPSAYPSAGLDSNYCRNPDGALLGPWCYSFHMRWEYCNIPKCMAQVRTGTYCEGTEIAREKTDTAMECYSRCKNVYGSNCQSLTFYDPNSTCDSPLTSISGLNCRLFNSTCDIPQNSTDLHCNGTVLSYRDHDLPTGAPTAAPTIMPTMPTAAPTPTPTKFKTIEPLNLSPTWQEFGDVKYDAWRPFVEYSMANIQLVQRILISLICAETVLLTISVIARYRGEEKFDTWSIARAGVRFSFFLVLFLLLPGVLRHNHLEPYSPAADSNYARRGLIWAAVFFCMASFEFLFFLPLIVLWPCEQVRKCHDKFEAWLDDESPPSTRIAQQHCAAANAAAQQHADRIAAADQIAAGAAEAKSAEYQRANPRRTAAGAVGGGGAGTAGASGAGGAGTGVTSVIQPLAAPTTAFGGENPMHGATTKQAAGGRAPADLHTWLGMVVGLKGKKFEAAIAACDHHLLESVEELMELHVEGKLSQVFEHIGVRLAIERALRNEADSNTPVPVAEVVAVPVAEVVANTLHQHSSAAVV